MAKISLSWFNEGREFEPDIYVDDIEEMERLERTAKTVTESVMGHRTILERILTRSLPEGVTLTTPKLKITQLEGAYWRVVIAGTTPAAEAEILPLGSSSTAPSSSRASQPKTDGA